MKKIFLLAILLPSLAFAQGKPLPAGVCDALKTARDNVKGPNGQRLENLKSLCPSPGATSCPVGKILNDVAFKFNMKLSGKSSGNHAASPVGKIAGDVLGDDTKEYWDVFQSWGGITTPQCGGSRGKITAADRPWLNPVDTGEPVPPEDPCKAYKEQIAALNATVGNLQNQNTELQTNLNACEAKLKECENNECPPQNCVAACTSTCEGKRFLGIFPTSCTSSCVATCKVQ